MTSAGGCGGGGKRLTHLSPLSLSASFPYQQRRQDEAMRSLIPAGQVNDDVETQHDLKPRKQPKMNRGPTYKDLPHNDEAPAYDDQGVSAGSSMMGSGRV